MLIMYLPHCRIRRPSLTAGSGTLYSLSPPRQHEDDMDPDEDTHISVGACISSQWWHMLTEVRGRGSPARWRGRAEALSCTTSVEQHRRHDGVGFGSGAREWAPQRASGVFCFLSINRGRNSKEPAFVVPIFADGQGDCMCCCWFITQAFGPKRIDCLHKSILTACVNFSVVVHGITLAV